VIPKALEHFLSHEMSFKRWFLFTNPGIFFLSLIGIIQQTMLGASLV